ncbi:bile acid:sodium symporter family protein [Niabella insulamsoli]|uniref:bile acid:sodium symporter family protein n=1 Tax=Niabella insulamsoli TaxID=3144874 RepID=UPI0031FC56C2
MKFKINSFVVAIVGSIALAWLYPEPVTSSGNFPINTVTTIGISLIFFFYGLKLSPEKIRAGVKNWKLHVVIQSATFLLFPLLVMAVYPFVPPGRHTLWLAFLFLAALPSTVSSSVVMVSVAKGNIAAAIFNASISGLIGIAVTPLWIGLFLQKANADFLLEAIYFNLLIEILLPVIAGLLLQRFTRRLIAKFGKYLSLFDKAVVLLIIYKSFATSFEERVFSSVSGLDFLLIMLAVVALFYTVYGVIRAGARWLGFDREDTIAALFCGTKKSLVHGTVFAKVLFPASAALGMVLLPVMIFHAFQIFVISVIAERYGAEKE